jgi:GntP family gluconate:H+ symporter
MSSGLQAIIGLIIAVIVLIVLILKTKIHAFLALIIAAGIAGIIGGLSPDKVAGLISTGFGNTLASIGIVIGFGVMMGSILEDSGAAETIALTFLKIFGPGGEEWALAFTGYVVSIPIFCDSGFVILFPIAKALSKKTRKSIVSVGVALAAGLVATHHLVPPTPGPLGAAGIFNADIGQVIIWGLLMSIPVVIATTLYAKWLGKKIYQLPEGDNWIRPSSSEKTNMPETGKTKEVEERTKSNLPSALSSFAPIVVPLILILLNTVLTAVKAKGVFVNYLLFFGSPVIAVGVGLIVAIYALMPHEPKSKVIETMEKGIKSAGIIILITGAGGALGYVLRQTGAGDYIAKGIAQSKIPAFLIPFLIATLVRLVQGSGTVAMITSASISAPILATLNINPVFATLAAASGAFIFSYFNDSYYWVVNRLMGITDVREQIRTWSVTTTIAWAVSFVILLVASFFIH